METAGRPEGPNALRLRWLVAVLVVGSCGLGVYWRLAPVGVAYFFGDEFHSLRLMGEAYSAIFTTYDIRGTGFVWLLLQRAAGDLFGYNPWALRSPSWLPGIVLLAATYPLGRGLVGRAGAVVATLLVAVSPALVFYSHFGRVYTLLAAMSLVLLFLLQRAVFQQRASGLVCGLLTLVTALLPYAHMTAVALVLSAYAGALIVLARQSSGRRAALRVALSLLASGAICLALHLPAWGSMLQFVRGRTGRSYFGTFDGWDVATVLAGGRPGAYVGVALLLASIAWSIVRTGDRLLPIVLACTGTPLALMIFKPYGDAYAWARYMVVCLPAVMLLLGWFVADVSARTMGKAARSEAAAMILGVGLAGLTVVQGPQGPGRVKDGPHANTYLNMVSLPAFDVPWPEMPGLYRQLARIDEKLRILEYPGMDTRTRHLYRNYFLHHGHETWLAFAPTTLETRLEGPYVRVGDASWYEAADADLLIVHINIADELSRYWQFVYGEQGDLAERAATRALMQRHSRYVLREFGVSRKLLQELHARLGEPVYSDGTVTAWKLTKKVELPGNGS